MCQQPELTQIKIVDIVETLVHIITTNGPTKQQQMLGKSHDMQQKCEMCISLGICLKLDTASIQGYMQG